MGHKSIGNILYNKNYTEVLCDPERDVIKIIPKCFLRSYKANIKFNDDIKAGAHAVNFSNACFIRLDSPVDIILCSPTEGKCSNNSPTDCGEDENKII